MLFTNTEAQDSNLLPAVLLKAQEKRITINIFDFNSGCSNDLANLSRLSDAAPSGALASMKLKRLAVPQISTGIYSQVSAGTGGLYRTSTKAEAANLTPFIENAIKPDIGTILRVEDTLSITGTTSMKTFDVPVDSFMNTVMFSLLGSSVSLSVTNPGGTLLTASTPLLTQTILQSSTSVSLSLPIPGIYKATVTGTDAFVFLGTGASTLQLSSFSFASIRGRPGHTG